MHLVNRGTHFGTVFVLAVHSGCQTRVRAPLCKFVLVVLRGETLLLTSETVLLLPSKVQLFVDELVQAARLIRYKPSLCPNRPEKSRQCGKQDGSNDVQFRALHLPT